jgi:hypothetical protein
VRTIVFVGAPPPPNLLPLLLRSAQGGADLTVGLRVERHPAEWTWLARLDSLLEPELEARRVVHVSASQRPDKLVKGDALQTQNTNCRVWAVDGKGESASVEAAPPLSWQSDERLGNSLGRDAVKSQPSHATSGRFT